MRGADDLQTTLFSDVSVEDRTPADHPLRKIHALVNPILVTLSPRFEALYARMGRPSIPPERLLRALLLQVLFTIRSERQLMEQLNYSLLFRWFVGLNPDDAVWVPTVFSKNRDRLIDGQIAEAFLQEVLQAADQRGLLSHEHFTVDGTLLEAWASHKSVRPKDDPSPPPSDGAQEPDRRLSAGTALERVTPPMNGTVVYNPDGTVTYTPNTGFVGVDTFKYVTCDNASPIK